MTKIKSNKNGFTLIELLVAMGIFVVITGIVSGVFINSMRSQKASVALMSANDAISLTLEQMAREIRTGTEFFIDSGALTFTNAKNKKVYYRLVGTAIEREEIDLETMESKKGSMTPDTAKILKFTINVSGNNPGDKQATRVTVSIGVGFPGKDVIYNTVQTTVSPRTINLTND